MACASNAAFLSAVYVFRSAECNCAGRTDCKSMFRSLLNHFFELLTDYRSVKTIDRDVKPVSFFAFHDEVRKTCGIGFVMPCLCDQVDE